MCDMRIASDKARFAVTFLKLGLIPGDGGAWLLPRIIGQDRAAQLLYTGDMIDAATALDWRLVTSVAPHDTLMDEALKLAQRIAQQPPHALRLAKNLLRHGVTSTYDTLMDMSAASQAIAHLTEDHMEGVDALLEGRPAVFKGK
jgi:enoyl-CoA hydratase/carnithine racemase